MSAITFPWFRKSTVLSVLLAFAPFALDGCLSIGVDGTRPKTPAAGAPASLEARLYETGKDAKRDVKSGRDVTWKLFRLDTSADVPVREGTGATWSATDLPPGKYRIAATWGPKPDVAGDVSAASGDDTFSLAAGESARADFVLKKFPTWSVWTVIAVILGVAAGIAIFISILPRGNLLSDANPVRDAGQGKELRESPGYEVPAA